MLNGEFHKSPQLPFIVKMGLNSNNVDMQLHEQYTVNLGDKQQSQHEVC